MPQAQPSYRPDVPKNSKNQTWPKSRDPLEVSGEKPTEKLQKRAKGRQGNSSGRGAQNEGEKSRAMLDSGLGDRGGSGNRERGRGKNRRAAVKKN